MKKKQPQYTTVFEPDTLRQIPVFYRFMSRKTKSELAKEEYLDVRTTDSKIHRSMTYFVLEPYKPLTKFLPQKWIQ